MIEQIAWKVRHESDHEGEFAELFPTIRDAVEHLQDDPDYATCEPMMVFDDFGEMVMLVGGGWIAELTTSIDPPGGWRIKGQETGE